jgi:hypothetical protein
VNQDQSVSTVHVPSLGVNDEVPPDAAALMGFMAEATIAFDGLWFATVVREIGRDRAFELDKNVLAALFKISTRIWRQISVCDPTTPEGKASVFRAISYLFHHEAVITADQNGARMSIRRCGVYEALKRSGLAEGHDCRSVCQYIAPRWYAEMDPVAAAEGEAGVDLQLPTGGPSCDWVLKQNTAVVE